MKNRNIYTLRIIGSNLMCIYNNLKGINPETKFEELICVDKFTNKSIDEKFPKAFYNIDCDNKSSDKYLDYVFSSDLSIPINVIIKLSACFKNFEFVLENKSSSNLNEKFRFLDGEKIAGGKKHHGRTNIRFR
jgi:hypothetical protein